MIRIGFIRSKICGAKYVPQDKRRVFMAEDKKEEIKII